MHEWAYSFARDMSGLAENIIFDHFLAITPLPLSLIPKSLVKDIFMESNWRNYPSAQLPWIFEGSMFVINLFKAIKGL